MTKPQAAKDPAAAARADVAQAVGKNSTLKVRGNDPTTSEALADLRERLQTIIARIDSKDYEKAAAQ